MKNIDLTKPIPEVLWEMYQYVRSIENMDCDQNFPTEEEIQNLRTLSGAIYATIADFVPTTADQVRIKLTALKDQAEKYNEEMSPHITVTTTQILKSTVV
jgi:DNA-directed RNA polymerase subunit F